LWLKFYGIVERDDSGTRKYSWILDVIWISARLGFRFCFCFFLGLRLSLGKSGSGQSYTVRTGSMPGKFEWLASIT